MFWRIDWNGIFTPTNSLVELVVRGTIMYFVLFGLLRLVLKRQAGGIGTTDVLVIVLLAEVAGNGFAAEYTSVVEGTVLIGTVLFWSYVVEWAAHRFPAVERVLHSPALVSSKRETAPQEHEGRTGHDRGADGAAAGKGRRGLRPGERACMEADGMISVIKRDV